jgi:hypothetical protein
LPIKPELRKFYGRQWADEIRPAILRRAGNRCEQCRVWNNVEVFRGEEGMWRVSGPHAPWHLNDGRLTMDKPMDEHRVRIVLTIAHLNHISGDDRPENLKALCQWCHLDFDKAHHAESRAIRKDASRPLLYASRPLLVGRDQSDGSKPPTEAKIAKQLPSSPVH